MPKPTVCLNMIVKDEANVVRRCLDSARPLIDHWLIVDTGSADGTQQIIRDHLRDIPGELVERPWRGFGHNRSEAIALARDHADYLLFIDADDTFEIDPGFAMPPLLADGYSLLIRMGGVDYWRPSLVATRLDWRYEGVLHEYLDCPQPHTFERLEGLRMIIRGGGARSSGISVAEKYARDARTLEAALKDAPGNARYAFYLAQSYRDSDQPEKALAAYLRRAGMGGWEEEAWYARYQAALLTARLGLPDELVVHRHLEAYAARPTRAEPLVDLAQWYRERRQWTLAHLMASRAILIPHSDDALFVEAAAYDWRAIDEFAVASYWVGDFKSCRAACEKLLATPSLPYQHLARVTENLNLAAAKLAGR